MNKKDSEQEKGTFQRFMLVGVVLLLLVPALAFAGGGKEKEPESAEAESPYGGRMTIGCSIPLETLALDVGSMYGNWGCLYYLLVYDNPMRFSKPPNYYEFTPELFTDWQLSDDRMSYTVQMVEDARWHDGEPVTAEDAKFTMEKLWSLPSWADPGVDFESIEIIDDHTLKVNSNVLVSGANPPPFWAWDPIVPKHIFEDHIDEITTWPNKEAIGSGPFKLKEFKPGEYMWLVANEDYWGGRPYLDEVVFQYYGNIDTMLMALRKGDINTITDESIPPQMVDDLEKEGDIKVEVVDGMPLKWLSYNLYKEGPLQDVKVRRAIQYALDRDRIIDMVYMGYAEKYNSWVYDDDPLYNPNLPDFEYDVDRANSILDDAGYTDTDGDGVRNDPSTGDNLVFELLVPAEATPAVKMGTLLAEMVPEAGIQFEFSTTDYDTFWDIIYYPMDSGYDIAISDEEPAPAPYADWIWALASSWDELGAEWNSSYYDNPRFDELMYALTEAPVMEARREISYELQEILARDIPYGFLVRPKFISAYRTDKIKGWFNEVGGPASWINDWSITEGRLKK